MSRGIAQLREIALTSATNQVDGRLKLSELLTHQWVILDRNFETIFRCDLKVSRVLDLRIESSPEHSEVNSRIERGSGLRRNSVGKLHAIWPHPVHRAPQGWENFPCLVQLARTVSEPLSSAPASRRASPDDEAHALVDCAAQCFRIAPLGHVAEVNVVRECRSQHTAPNTSCCSGVIVASCCSRPSRNPCRRR